MTDDKTFAEVAASIKPSVGRVVHYVEPILGSYANEGTGRQTICRAAMVTFVPENVRHVEGKDIVSLFIFGPSFTSSISAVAHDESTPHVANTWHWPERVEQ